MDDTTEHWKPVPSYYGFHASSLGRIRGRRGGVVGSRDRDGYIKVLIYRGAAVTPITAYAHRMVAEAFLGAPSPDADVDHIDGNRTNNRPENLRYLSHADNVKATMLAGRASRGEAHPPATMTEATALSILQEFRPSHRRGRHVNNPYCAKALADKYELGYSAVHHLVQGLTWKHLSRDGTFCRPVTAELDGATPQKPKIDTSGVSVHPSLQKGKK